MHQGGDDGRCGGRSHYCHSVFHSIPPDIETGWGVGIIDNEVVPDERISHFMVDVSQPKQGGIAIGHGIENFRVFGWKVIGRQQCMYEVHKGAEVSLSVGVGETALRPSILAVAWSEGDAVDTMGR